MLGLLEEKRQIDTERSVKKDEFQSDLETGAAVQTELTMENKK